MEQFTMTEEEKREHTHQRSQRRVHEENADDPGGTEGGAQLDGRRPLHSGAVGIPNLPGPMYPPYDFLDCYRLDREIERETAGMNRNEKIRYLKEYWGWDDDEEEAEKPAATLEEA